MSVVPSLSINALGPMRSSLDCLLHNLAHFEFKPEDAAVENVALRSYKDDVLEILVLGCTSLHR